MKRLMTPEQLARRLARRSPTALMMNVDLPAGMSKREVARAAKPYRDALKRMCLAVSADEADRRRGS